MPNQEKLAKDLVLKLKENLNEVKQEAQKNFSTLSGYDSGTIELKKIVDSVTRAEDDLKRNCSF
jgi:hypothetical protein